MSRKKSKSAKIIQGTFRKDRDTKNIPLCKTDKIPDPPKVLDKIALQEWDRVAPLLFKSGLLSDLDVTALAGYCMSWSRFKKAESALEGQPLTITGATGAQIKNPLISISRMAADQMLQMARHFGLTPASRSKVMPKGKKKKDTWEDF